MIEKTIRDYLNSALSVPVFCERPETEPDEYVLVSKTGSKRENLLMNSHVLIQARAQSLYRAMVLNAEIIDAMDIDNIPDVNCELEGDYSYSDPATKTYRYQCAYNIFHY